MTKVVADNYPRNISQYVPNMEFAADVIDGVHIVTLGSPAALDADGIWDGVTANASANTYTSADYKNTFDGSSTSVTTTSGMIDALYGRCVTAVGSAGSNHVVTVIGKDYLGQGMREQFTLSGTTILYGKKAFKFVDSMTVAAGAAGDTARPRGRSSGRRREAARIDWPRADTDPCRATARYRAPRHANTDRRKRRESAAPGRERPRPTRIRRPRRSARSCRTCSRADAETRRGFPNRPTARPSP